MKSPVKRLLGAVFLAVTAGAFALGTANAEATFDDAKIEAYVTASIAIDALVNQWEPKIDAAKSEAEAQKMKEQANTELTAAIEKTKGITVDEYQQIIDTATKDPAMQQRLRKAFEKRMGK